MGVARAQSERRRDRSERNDPFGSSSARSARNSGSRGYMAASVSGRSLESFARQTRPCGNRHLFVQPVEEAGQARQGGRQIEGERPARHREGQPARITVPEALEHGEERRAAALRDPPDDPSQRLFLSVPDDELVPHGAAAAVDAVPVRYGVQQVEVRGQPLEFTGAELGGSAVPELVEQGDRGTAEQPVRYERRRRGQPARAEHERCAPVARREHMQGCVLPAGEYGAPGRPAAGEEVDPGGRVAVPVVGGGEPGHQVVQIDGPFGVDRHE